MHARNSRVGKRYQSWLRRDRFQRCEAGLIGRLAVKARMWFSAVVEAEVLPDGSLGLGHRVVGSKLYPLVFDRPPKPLDKDTVAP
jgi:hypothetical protein